MFNVAASWRQQKSSLHHFYTTICTFSVVWILYMALDKISIARRGWDKDLYNHFQSKENYLSILSFIMQDALIQGSRLYFYCCKCLKKSQSWPIFIWELKLQVLILASLWSQLMFSSEARVIHSTINQRWKRSQTDNLYGNVVATYYILMFSLKRTGNTCMKVMTKVPLLGVCFEFKSN